MIINEDGVYTLKTSALQAVEEFNKIQTETDKILDYIKEYGDVLGPHKSQLMYYFEDIQNSINKLEIPINLVSDKLLLLFNEYLEIINDNPFV